MILTKRFIWNWAYHINCILFIVQGYGTGSVFGGASHCLNGQISHKLPGTLVTRCCIPWPYNCPPDYPYSICRQEGGWDSCKKCPTNHILSEMSNSTNLMPCYENTSCQTAEMTRVKKTGSKETECVCDRRRDYKAFFSSACDPVHKSQHCKGGEERQEDGSCRECVIGTYKDWIGPGLCIPITNCVRLGMNATSPLRPDRDSCYDVTTVTTPIRTSPAVFITTTTQNSSNPVPPGTSSEKPDTTNWKIAGPCIAVGLVFIIICVIWFLKRRPTRRCCTYNSVITNDPDIELNNLNDGTNTVIYEEIPDGNIPSNGIPGTVIQNGSASPNRPASSNGRARSNGPDSSNGPASLNRPPLSNRLASPNGPASSNGRARSNGPDSSNGPASLNRPPLSSRPASPNGPASSKGRARLNGPDSSNGPASLNRPPLSNRPASPNGPGRSNGPASSNEVNPSYASVSANVILPQNGCVPQESSASDEVMLGDGNGRGEGEDVNKPTARVAPLCRHGRDEQSQSREEQSMRLLQTEDEYSRIGNVPQFDSTSALQFDSVDFPSHLSSGEQLLPEHSQLQLMEFPALNAANIRNNGEENNENGPEGIGEDRNAENARNDEDGNE